MGRKRNKQPSVTYKSVTADLSDDIVREIILICSVIGSESSVVDSKQTNERELALVSDNNQTTKFIPVTDVLQWLQDLQRCIRRDDDVTRGIGLLLHQLHTITQKLLPILSVCSHDRSVVLTLCKLLVILSKPPHPETLKTLNFALKTAKRVESDVLAQFRKRKENAVEQMKLLNDFKVAFLGTNSKNPYKKQAGDSSQSVLPIFVSLLTEPLARTGSKRTEGDSMTIELVLHLIRNLLHPNPHTPLDVHHALVKEMQRHHVLDLVTVLAQEVETRENQHYNLILLEILNGLSHGMDPEQVARAKAKMYSGESLKDKLRKEKRKVESSGRVNSRHGSFGGSLVLSYGKSKQVISNTSTDLKLGKDTRKKQNALFVSNESDDCKRYSSTNVANAAMYDFTTEFLDQAYGSLMKSLKNEFRRDSARLEAGDKVTYFHVVKFFSRFQRAMNKESFKNGNKTKTKSVVGNIVFTMDVFSFNLVLSSILSQIQLKQYSDLSVSVGLLCEMMKLLLDMFTSKDETETLMVFGLMDRLFYSNDPLDKTLDILKAWSTKRFGKIFMQNAIELVHTTLKLMESCKADVSSKVEINKKVDKNGRMYRMQKSANEFDIQSYFHRMISRPIVEFYMQALSCYRDNSAVMNHQIVSFLIRLCKVVIQKPERVDNQLASKTVTLEPLLYDFSSMKVFNSILNDRNIHGDRDYKNLIDFSSTIVRHFATLAIENPMLYTECIISSKQRVSKYCVSVVSSYVSEELVLMGERERLMAERLGSDVVPEVSSDVVPEGDPMNQSNAGTSSIRLKALQLKKAIVDDSEDEWESDEEEEYDTSKKNFSKEDDQVLREAFITAGNKLNETVAILLKSSSGLNPALKKIKLIKNRIKELKLRSKSKNLLKSSVKRKKVPVPSDSSDDSSDSSDSSDSENEVDANSPKKKRKDDSIKTLKDNDNSLTGGDADDNKSGDGIGIRSTGIEDIRPPSVGPMDLPTREINEDQKTNVQDDASKVAVTSDVLKSKPIKAKNLALLSSDDESEDEGNGKARQIASLSTGGVCKTVTPVQQVGVANKKRRILDESSDEE